VGDRPSLFLNLVKPVNKKTSFWLNCRHIASLLVVMQEESFGFFESDEMASYHVGMKRCTVQRQGVGARLTDLRIQAGLSQQDLAERIGVPLANIGFWERTSTPPSSKVLPKLADALSTTVEEILTGKPKVSVRKGGPSGKMRQLFESASRLPRSQQQKVAAVLEPFILQHSNER
jgi:transcriptional regulator with XRE-family HTH domain